MQNSHVLLTFSDVHIQFPVLAFLCVSDKGECFDLLTLYVIIIICCKSFHDNAMFSLHTHEENPQPIFLLPR